MTIAIGCGWRMADVSPPANTRVLEGFRITEVSLSDSAFGFKQLVLDPARVEREIVQLAEQIEGVEQWEANLEANVW